jgi:hypothetical protein
MSPEGLVMASGIKVGGGTWVITGDNAVSGVGPESATETTCSSKCAELMIIGKAVSPEFCTQYNQLAASTLASPPLDSSVAGDTPFTGTFDAGTSGSHLISTGTGNATSALYNVKTACVTSSTMTPVYLVYYVLVQR